MRKIFFLFLLSMLLIPLGCQKQDQEPAQVEPPKLEFVPPEDRKITEEQAVRYIEAAKLSQLVIIDYQAKRKEFEKKHNLSEDQSELQDTLFLREHPEVKQKHLQLQKWFEIQMDSVYVKSNISDEEFTWIGGALGDTVNAKIQKKVEVALNAFAEELEKEGS